MKTTVAANLGNIAFDDAYGLCGSGELAGVYNEIAGLGDFEGSKTEIKTIDDAIKKDRIAQKMISVPVFDALSNWRGLADGVSDSEGINIDGELNLALHFQDVAEKSRKYGLAIILPIITDERDREVSLSRDLNELGKGKIIRLAVLHEKINATEIEDDISKEGFGFPKKLSIGSTTIHPSRVIFIGQTVDPIENSFFKSVVNDLAEFHEAKKRKQNAVRRNSSFVYEGDFEQVREFIIDRADATGQTIDINKITETMARALHKNLNESNVAVINKGDAIHNFQQNNINQIISHVDQTMQVLAGVSDIPLSRLFGKNTGGLSNSGQTDYENYSQALDGWRAKEIEQPLARMDAIISKVYDINFSRDEWVWLPTRAEEIRLRLAGQQVEPEVNPENA